MTAEDILSSRDAFNAFVYLSWEDAIAELERRQGNRALEEYVEKTVTAGIPEIMKGKKSAVIFRHIATTNYEVHRFLVAADALKEHGLQPLILEYTKDKFTNRNVWKFSLAKLSFHKGHSKTNEMLVENKTIIDINDSNFKPLDTITTHWGQGFVDFHHEMFYKTFPHMEGHVHDLSDWLQKAGPAPKEFYKSFFALFLRNGILFENFLIEDDEYDFTHEIILPAILELAEESGFKPIIVALEPTEIEGDRFWLSHPIARMQHVSEKLP